MSTTDQTAASLFRSGNLTGAIAAAQATLRKAPTDLGARVLLAELLCFGSNLERADVILDAASTIDPSSALVVAEFRQLVRADMARRQLFRDGRVPEFLGEPTETQRMQLAAFVALRAGDIAEAATQAAGAEAARPHCAGKHKGTAPTGTAFDDLRDVDDLLAGTLEVLTTTGKYYWIPIERLISVTFHPPKRPRDLLWRRASVSVDAGPDGDVYVPVVYAGDETMTEGQRLGRETDWQQAEGGPVRGIGQRVFLLGEDDVAVMDLSELTFTNAGGA